MRAQRLVPLVVLALLVRPSPAAAQKDPFFEALLTFYQSVAGVYGDEGTQLTAGLDTLSAALATWDREFAAAESQLRAELKKATAVPRSATGNHAATIRLLAGIDGASAIPTPNRKINSNTTAETAVALMIPTTPCSKVKTDHRNRLAR